MDQGFRRGFTAAEKAELWDRWQRGESLKAIGRAFGKPSSSIYFQVDCARDLPGFRAIERVAAFGLDLGLVMGSSEVYAAPSAAPPQPRGVPDSSAPCAA